MKNLSQTKQFSRDVKRMRNRGKDLDKLKLIVTILAMGKPIEPKHRDHPLSGDWKGCRDCHIESDWVLIYTTDERAIRLERTGSHNDLFQ